MRHSRRQTGIAAVFAVAALAASPADLKGQTTTNPFLDLVGHLTGAGSKFNGPDRGGKDTLHGEIWGSQGDEMTGHWWENEGIWNSYEALNSSQTSWDSIPVPKWQDNNAPKAWINPKEPVFPQYDTTDDVMGDDGTYSNGGDLLIDGDVVHVVTGRFLVGAVLWPHEEYIEQWVDPVGQPFDIGNDHKVPVYWMCSYALYIPNEYADSELGDTNRTGKALIIYGKGGNRAGDPGNNFGLPGWAENKLRGQDGPNLFMNGVFDEDSWSYQGGVMNCQRLRVPVLQLMLMPVDDPNVWGTGGDAMNEQGGVTGYDTEQRMYFSAHWATKALTDTDDLIVNHPQYLYAASYIRARTFLDGFFNPGQGGLTDRDTDTLADWSEWPLITGYDSVRYTPITDAIIEGGSKRGHAVWIAALADENISACVSNGMAHLRVPQDIRLMGDELWEKNERDYSKVKGKPEYYGSTSQVPDWNQIFPDGGSMQSRIDALGRVYRGEAQKHEQFYDLYPVFKDRDVMQDFSRPENPLDEIAVYNTYGMQDTFWARQAFSYWVDDEVFHGDHQYFDFAPHAVHPPYYLEFTRKLPSFCEAVWDARPMPTTQITDIDYPLPELNVPVLPGEEPILRIKARFTIANVTSWQLKDYGTIWDPADPQNFEMRLCVGLRPAHETMSRGMWSIYSKYDRSEDKHRSSPWWEIPPSSLQSEYDPITDTLTYDAEFEFVSTEYADIVNDGSGNPHEFLPVGFENWIDEPNEAMIVSFMPPGFHSAFYVRCAVEHEQSQLNDIPYPVRVSSMVEYLPPWEQQQSQ